MRGKYFNTKDVEFLRRPPELRLIMWCTKTHNPGIFMFAGELWRSVISGAISYKKLFQYTAYRQEAAASNEGGLNIQWRVWEKNLTTKVTWCREIVAFSCRYGGDGVTELVRRYVAALAGEGKRSVKRSRKREKKSGTKCEACYNGEVDFWAN